MIEEELIRLFEERKPALAALGAWVCDVVKGQLISDLGSECAAEKFFQIPPKARVKTTDSFLEKLLRKPKSDPFIETTDQVGVRFVVLLLEDIRRIGELIESGPWAWQKDRDHELERLQRPDYFAYQSDHYVIRTKEQFEFQGTLIPVDFPCEVQIRTILQHAYAEMAHGCDYKPSIRLPDREQQHVKRALAKGSALIETTDDVFKEIRGRLKDYGESVDSLLVKSAEIYQHITREAAPSATPLGQTIADVYRDELKILSPLDLEKWANERHWLGKVIIRKRKTSVFYRDSVVILLGWLITEHPTTVPKYWPIDRKYLEDFYSTLGISIEGVF